MRSSQPLLPLSLLVTLVALAGCKITKQVEMTSANEADATFVFQYEHGFEQYVVDWENAEEQALSRCQSWGYSGVELTGSGSIECIEVHERNVTGARPSGMSEEPGMGTKAAERERDRRNLGTVGQSVRDTDPPPPGAEEGCVYWRVTYTGHCIR